MRGLPAHLLPVAYGSLPPLLSQVTLSSLAAAACVSDGTRAHATCDQHRIIQNHHQQSVYPANDYLDFYFRLKFPFKRSREGKSPGKGHAHLHRIVFSSTAIPDHSRQRACSSHLPTPNAFDASGRHSIHHRQGQASRIHRIHRSTRQTVSIVLFLNCAFYFSFRISPSPTFFIRLCLHLSPCHSDFDTTTPTNTFTFRTHSSSLINFSAYLNSHLCTDLAAQPPR